ncbi:MAG: alpha-amylase/4-alpha-glucanotransferase domain-containing protein [Chloroflexota bacterium]
MARRISLALTLHNHQPIGNFGWVIEETYVAAYLPMVEALERHASVRMGLHYTGPLLEWLHREHPEFLDRVRALAARGQVEILGGGYFEPVLASIPERDRVAQLVRMADEIERIFGRRPTTAWLAERVWEPDLPTALVAAGYRATILDDSHFRAAGIAEDAMWGPYSTEDQGQLINVFGSEQGLRNRIPFRPVEDVIAHLRDNATEDGTRLGTMGDDGEKFGAWPSTGRLCWGQERWVDRFFEALEDNAEWLATTTPADWLVSHQPLGRVYIPVSSYAEMGAWALLPDEGRAFMHTLERDRAEGRPEPRWMRGASWRNFQVKYREVNDIHKRMLRVSAKVDGLPSGALREQAHDHLLRGQSNDIYWHGLFGGIYLPDLRVATVGHLVEAEALADAAADDLTHALVADLDLDGRDEVLLADAGQVVTIDLDDGAGIGDWDIRAARHALTSVLRRRPEAYHAAIERSARAAAAVGATGDAVADAGHGGGTNEGSSVDGVLRAKEAGLADHLTYDDHERRSGLVRFLPVGAAPADYGAGEIADLGTLIGAGHTIDALADRRLVVSAGGVVRAGTSGVPVTLTKVVELGGERLAPTLRVKVRIRNAGDERLEARLGIEWALMLLGGGGNPSAWFEVRGERHAHDAPGMAALVDAIGQGNDWLGVSVVSRPSPAADAWWAPIQTVSNSEDGFERVYQGASLLLSWLIDLAPGEEQVVEVLNQVAVAADRAAPTGGLGVDSSATGA